MVAYTRYPWDPRVRREAETLVRQGHAVTVICNREPGHPAEEVVAGVRVLRMPLEIRRGGSFRYLFQYIVFFLMAAISLRRFRPYGVHIHSLPDFLAFAAIGPKARGVPLALDLHEALPEIVRARFPRSVFAVGLARAAEKLSTGFADHVIVVNETIRDVLAARGIPLDRITVVYNSPDAPPGPVQAVESPLETSALRLVYAGTIDPERDLATLIRAVGELSRTVPTGLVMYGRAEPEHRAYLEGLIDGLGLRDRVRLGGVLRPESVLPHLAHSDVGVVTYARNPLTDLALPNKVFESVLLEKPLVLPDLRAMRRAFADAAWFYQPGNASDLAAKIREAATAGAEGARRRGRARAVYEYARWEVQAERLAALYPRRTTRASAEGLACT